MRDDLGTQLLQLFSGGPDENVFIGRPFYCGKGYEYDLSVRYLYLFLVDCHGKVARRRNVPLLL